MPGRKSFTHLLKFVLQLNPVRLRNRKELISVFLFVVVSGHLESAAFIRFASCIIFGASNSQSPLVVFIIHSAEWRWRPHFCKKDGRLSVDRISLWRFLASSRLRLSRRRIGNWRNKSHENTILQMKTTTKLNYFRNASFVIYNLPGKQRIK